MVRLGNETSILRGRVRYFMLVEGKMARKGERGRREVRRTCMRTAWSAQQSSCAPISILVDFVNSGPEQKAGCSCSIIFCWTSTGGTRTVSGNTRMRKDVRDKTSGVALPLQGNASFGSAHRYLSDPAGHEVGLKLDPCINWP